MYTPTLGGPIRIRLGPASVLRFFVGARIRSRREQTAAESETKSWEESLL